MFRLQDIAWILRSRKISPVSSVSSLKPRNGGSVAHRRKLVDMGYQMPLSESMMALNTVLFAGLVLAVGYTVYQVRAEDNADSAPYKPSPSDRPNRATRRSKNTL
eukprot:g62231.t1